MGIARHAAALLTGVGLWVVPVGAQAQSPVVVELFTSQGCSACPPADGLLAQLADREGVIALALHVDYWDYIGWADTFAQPAFTQRQHDYGVAAGSTVVYTPQMVIGGADHVVGFRPMEVADLLMEHGNAPDPVRLSVDATGDGYDLQADWLADTPAPPMVVHLVAYQPEERVEIARGENAGRVAEYHNIVRAGMCWPIGTGPRRLRPALRPRMGCRGLSSCSIAITGRSLPPLGWTDPAERGA
ncbi:hypothetical protein that often co-occurs with aconitase [Roseibacterium elongatum DSM 19469]|uniref:DUF1223 domain-containing protein n=1 Tax=Roseicyclus elongatus DSM 19469 TaxID=1294273 RepID=W8RW52_9RHOB|nr:DUF1223 domain-containing protein [Roseibacterium elongatum]AHM05533.1 hypothetical protein that often co-occurs with aconitase [Roseibacterium elongatum DSM 19469]